MTFETFVAAVRAALVAPSIGAGTRTLTLGEYLQARTAGGDEHRIVDSLVRRALYR